MRNYFVRFLMYCVLLVGMVSCTTANLDKKYSASSRENDYNDLSKLISAEELQLLKDYICDSRSWYINDYTYREILEQAKSEKEEKMRQKQREEEEKKIIQQKTELLCGKKWKLKNMEFVVERTDDSLSVFKLTDHAVNAFSNKRWKIYASDGTYQEIFGDEKIQKGSWRFVSPDEIREVRPLTFKVHTRLKKNDIYILAIKMLNEKQLYYNESLSSSGLGYNSVPLLVTMESQE